jgi:hypothetical protein
MGDCLRGGISVGLAGGRRRKGKNTEYMKMA